jgi:hypothetical protein
LRSLYLHMDRTPLQGHSTQPTILPLLLHPWEQTLHLRWLQWYRSIGGYARV